MYERIFEIFQWIQEFARNVSWVYIIKATKPLMVMGNLSQSAKNRHVTEG